MSNYTKLKTNLKLAITRLKLLEKKKSKFLTSFINTSETKMKKF